MVEFLRVALLEEHAVYQHEHHGDSVEKEQ